MYIRTLSNDFGPHAVQVVAIQQLIDDVQTLNERLRDRQQQLREKERKEAEVRAKELEEKKRVEREQAAELKKREAEREEEEGDDEDEDDYSDIKVWENLLFPLSLFSLLMWGFRNLELRLWGADRGDCL